MEPVKAFLHVVDVLRVVLKYKVVLFVIHSPVFGVLRHSRIQRLQNEKFSRLPVTLSHHFLVLLLLLGLAFALSRSHNNESVRKKRELIITFLLSILVAIFRIIYLVALFLIIYLAFEKVLLAPRTSFWFLLRLYFFFLLNSRVELDNDLSFRDLRYGPIGSLLIISRHHLV